MKIRIASDLHLEFDHGYNHVFELPRVEDEKNTVLVLAGDVGLADKPHTYIDFLRDVTDRFRHVVYIPGNHEYYKTSFNRGLDKINDAIAMPSQTGRTDNITAGDGFVCIEDDVAFVCATLWTDMNNSDPHTMFYVRERMNDFRLIRVGSPDNPYGRRWKPEDCIVEFNKAKKFIFENIKHFSEEGLEVVVVTHHLPTPLSINERYVEEPLMNGGYASNLFEEIANSKAVLWIHGHTHSSCDYDVEGTRVVCNPRGYYMNEENPKFDPTLTIEV